MDIVSIHHPRVCGNPLCPLPSSAKAGISSAQRGRSMVEMIGVLALIGVLSVSAVTGFRYAMDKIKVNQILNDVSLGFAQIQTMETVEVNQDFTLGFTPDSGLDTAGFYDDLDYEYIKVSNVPKSVCEKLRSFENYDVIGLIYKEDTKTRLRECVDTQTMAFRRKGDDKCFSDVFVDGICCQSAVACDDVCCEAGNVCQNNICTPAQENSSCETNADCGGIGSKYFCAFDNPTSCSEWGYGRCQPLNRYSSLKVNVDNITWISALNTSGIRMNWQTSQNWCSAQKGYIAAKQSYVVPVYKQLYNAGCFGWHFIQCDTDCGSCGSYIINLNNGRVRGYDWDIDTRALCRRK